MLLKRLKRWLGWDSDSGSFDFADLDRPRSRPPKPVVRAAQQARPADAPRPAERRAKEKERDPLDVLDNPRLSLDKPADDGFDPYNTGAFNRSTSWEKIGRQRKR